METCRRIEGLVDFIAGRYSKIAEIGIGLFPDVAHALIEKGTKVFATDIVPVYYDGVKVIVDDITDPDISLYNQIDLIYSMRPPPELFPYMKSLAKKISADLIVKPLSSDYIEGLRPIRHRESTFFVWNHEQILCVRR